MSDADTTPAPWRALKLDGFIGLIGPLLRSTRPHERAVFALQTRDAHGNAIGLIHGGVLSSLLDQVIALTAWDASDRSPTVTVQMDTRFLGAARPGDFLEARARISHTTGALLFVDADVTCGPKPIASASAIMKISRQTGKSND